MLGPESTLDSTFDPHVEDSKSIWHLRNYKFRESSDLPKIVQQGSGGAGIKIQIKLAQSCLSALVLKS